LSTNPTDFPGRPVLVMTLPQAPLPDARPVDRLYQPMDSDAWVPPLDTARRLAEADLAKHQVANIHDHQAMVQAAVTLEIRLRQLLGALDADGAA